MIRRLWDFSQTPDGDGIIGAAIVAFGLLAHARSAICEEATK